MASPSRSFIVIVAAAAGSLGIGKNGSLPWRLAGDMAYFKKVTTTSATQGKINAVIMGRKTWESIPVRFRPLQGRRNIVLSRNIAAREELLLPEDVLLARSLPEALALLAREPHSESVDKVFVIGGGSVYAEAVRSELCEKILLTSVRAEDGRFDDCDVHFPTLMPGAFKLVTQGVVHEENGIKFSFDEYHHVRHTRWNGEGVSNDPEKIPTTEYNGNSSPPIEDDKENARGSQHGMSAGKRQKDLGTSAQKANGVDPGDLRGREQSQNLAAGIASAPGMTEAREGCEIPDDCSDNKEEMQYLNLVEDILDNGVERGDRTGTGTLSKFGVQMRFSLRGGRFPLLTTKRVFWRGVAEELLWFISGCTNANVLKEKGIHIWDGNGSREFLDK